MVCMSEMQRGPNAKPPSPTFKLLERLSTPSHASANMRLRPVSSCSVFPVLWILSFLCVSVFVWCVRPFLFSFVWSFFPGFFSFSLPPGSLLQGLESWHSMSLAVATSLERVLVRSRLDFCSFFYLYFGSPDFVWIHHYVCVWVKRSENLEFPDR